MIKFSSKVIPKWKAFTIGQRTRKRYSSKIRQFKVIAGFLLSGDKQAIYVLIKKYVDKQEY